MQMTKVDNNHAATVKKIAVNSNKFTFTLLKKREWVLCLEAALAGSQPRMASLAVIWWLWSSLLQLTD
jgi:hypothetical protein